MANVLFICSKNKWRSPTAEYIFDGYSNLRCMSAGLSNEAENPVTPELLEWADMIFVMEKMHREKLNARFKKELHHKKVICLNIPDKYVFMAPELIAILKKKVSPYLENIE